MNKVSKNRENKEKLVAGLSEKVAKAKAIVFANYQGMTHVQLEGLKKALKASEAELVVTKNTLVKIALDQTKGLKIDDLQGGTVTLFAYKDIVAPLKEIAKSFKNIKFPQVKFGFLDGKMISTEEVLRLGTLPSREVLLAQLVGNMKAPISGLHRALSWNLQKFVMTLGAIQKQRVSSIK